MRDPSAAAAAAAAMNLAVGNNFRLNEKPCVSFEPTKKRKLEHEHVNFPLSKLKFKDRSCGPDDESSCGNHTGQYPADCRMEESQEYLTDTELDTSPWSLKDSNTINDGCDSAVTVDMDKTAMSSLDSWYPNRYSTSSSSCNNYAFKDTYHNVDGSKSSPVIQGGDSAKGGEVEDEVWSKHQMCSGDKDDFLELEQISELEEESLLFSNSLLANTFIPSSGSDGAGHAADVQHGSRKPTIDQEFEQYFSMLML